MGAISQKLTALAVKNAKPGKHFDGGGLYVEVTAKGGRRWYLKYRWPDGRENRLSLGAGLSLSDARAKADNARALIREGLDPAAVKAEQKTKAKREAEGIFPKVAEAWLAYDNKECQWAPETLRKAEYVVRQYLTPFLAQSAHCHAGQGDRKGGACRDAAFTGAQGARLPVPDCGLRHR